LRQFGTDAIAPWTALPKLAAAARKAIAHAEMVAVSAASAWEAAIKARLGRLRLPEPFATGVTDSGFSELSVRFAHAERAADLPRHHADPFDRMLVCQAVVEGLVVLTPDAEVTQVPDSGGLGVNRGGASWPRFRIVPVLL